MGTEEAPYVEILDAVLPAHVMQSRTLTQSNGKESMTIAAANLGQTRKQRIQIGECKPAQTP